MAMKMTPPPCLQIKLYCHVAMTSDLILKVDHFILLPYDHLHQFTAKPSLSFSNYLVHKSDKQANE